MRAQLCDSDMSRPAYYSTTCASNQSCAAKVWLCSTLKLYLADDPVADDANLCAFDGITFRSSHSHSRRAPGFSTTPPRRSLTRWRKNVSSPEIPQDQGA